MKKQISSTQKVLNIWALILILWSLYRVQFTFPEWFDEFIAKPLLFIGPVAWYILKYEKKPFFSSVWIDKKKVVRDIYLATIVGLLFFIVAFIPIFIKTGSFPFFEKGSLTYWYHLASFIPVVVATAISEEILSRGFVLKTLYEESNNIVSSTFIASILFFILHIPILFTNLKLTGHVLIFFMITDLILSFANSFIYIGRRSLVLPILIHALYNLTLLLAI